MKRTQLRLSEDERRLKRVVQMVLFKNKVLSSMTEREWNVFATRRLLQEFLKARKSDAKPAKPLATPPTQQPAPQTRTAKKVAAAKKT